MFDTITFLRFLGSPFISDKNDLPNKWRRYFYEFSSRNRLPLLYLEQLRKTNNLGYLKDFYIEIYNRYLSFLECMNNVSLILNKRGIDHAIFKTFRIYPWATGDIDVLIMGSDADFKRASKVLFESGYGMLGGGPQSITFRDRTTTIGIDLYRDIAVSHLIYLDKRILSGHIIEKHLPNDRCFLSLSPAADLVSLIAHSVIKEQMQKLSDYYFFLYHIKEMDSRDINKFIHLVKTNHLIAATRAYLTVIKKLHNEAHRFTPPILNKIFNEFGLEPIEESRFIEKAYMMPHKYHSLTFLKAFFEKLREKRTRVSLVSQFLGILEPSFFKEVINGVLSHTKRESY